MKSNQFTSLTAVLIALISLAWMQNKQPQTTSKKELDKQAIRSLAGCYKVTFEFAETFSPDSNYAYYDRKFDWGIEKVFLFEESENHLALQHILIINDTTIIKHWRQDWIFENTVLLDFIKDYGWVKKFIDPKVAQGTWTQKVYQVDDSPRYEGFGTWIHVDGRHFWQSKTDAPLPRREFTIRNDYNVLKRQSHIELTDYGWILEQDNQKVKRTEDQDILICWEKGFEKFFKGNFDCSAADEWWNKNQLFWADVRAVWNDVISQQDNIQFIKSPDNKPLFTKMFALGERYAKQNTYPSSEVKKEIKTLISSYLQL